MKIKKLLFEKCQKYADQRIENARNGMALAQQAANEEMKSSAGDKYNTGRALMQIERDKYAKQFVEAQKLFQALDLISLTKHFNKVELGSLVETSNGNYFMSISMGKIDVDGYTAYSISPASPLGQQLLGKMEGEKAVFNKKEISIHKII